MTADPGRPWLRRAVQGAVLAVALFALSRFRADPRALPSASDAGETSVTRRDPATGLPPPRPPYEGDAWSGDATALDAANLSLDCARPQGDVARVDSEAISAERLCARLRRIGAVTASGPDGQQTRWVLDQLIDVTLVRHALAFERAEVPEAEVTTALVALLSDAGPRAAADDTLLREQLRERMELRALLRLRHPIEVTEAQVEAELARGAPGIDRGQGVRVEGWIARTPPGVDAGERPAAQRAAEDFARAIEIETPEAAAARLRLTRLAPFVVGINGVEPELERAATSVPEGRWSGAVRTRVGWAVLRVMGAVEGARIPDGVLRARVREALENRALQDARNSSLEQLRAAARVERLIAP